MHRGCPRCLPLEYSRYYRPAIRSVPATLRSLSRVCAGSLNTNPKRIDNHAVRQGDTVREVIRVF